jgi:hypothetical protein
LRIRIWLGKNNSAVIAKWINTSARHAATSTILRRGTKPKGLLLEQLLRIFPTTGFALCAAWERTCSRNSWIKQKVRIMGVTLDGKRLFKQQRSRTAALLNNSDNERSKHYE